uniref:SXP/RAL-2 family protein Ani s 5-like cation-binding domain-containing protein n=1 Tax=Panagrolaimus superbus TaxID=310955 RepID=A0A914Y618_9BILA
MVVSIFLLSLFCVCIVGQETPAPIVPALLQLDEATKSKVESILINQNLPLKEINSQVDAIFAQQSPSISSQYTVTKEAYLRAVNELEKHHIEEIKAASPPTQAADSEIRKIANNDSLTSLQQNRGILQIYLAQTPDVQKELKQYAIFRRN